MRLIRIHRICIKLILFVFTLLILSAAYRLYKPFTREFDAIYISRNCTNFIFKTNPLENLSSSRRFNGVVYFYQSTPGKLLKDDFNIASRSIASEFFCLPYFGCLTNPYLSKMCK